MIAYLVFALMGPMINVGPDLAEPEPMPFVLEDGKAIIEGCEDWNEPDWSEFLSKHAPSPLARGEHQYLNADGTRVDIFNSVYSIEVEHSSKWKEAIGQALFYATINNNSPAIILLVKPNTNFKLDYLRLTLVANKYDIQVWVVDPKDHYK